jgi:Protein of unknown function (DUF3108)
MRRSFSIALLLSALLHLIVLAAPGWQMGGGLPEMDAMPIAAQLIIPAKKKSSPRKAVHPVAAAPEQVPVAHPAPSVEPPAQTEDVASAPDPAPEVVPPTPEVKEANPAVVAEEIPEVAPPLPRSGRIRFSISRGTDGFAVGQSIHEWHHDNKHYSIHAISETTGIAAIFKSARVTQTSEGGFLKGDLKPENFSFDRGGNDIVSASFDWQAQKVTLGDGQIIDIADGAEDFLSMFYQLTQAAQRGEGFVMAVATGRKVERYAFEWLEEEELSLKPGRYKTWHVRVRAADGGKDITDVWLGQEVAGLPVKIRHTDRKGDVSEQVAQEISYEGK